jgi:hypothetical protein
MRQIVYNLHFRSKATPTDSEGKVLRATGSAVSGSTTTLVSPDGVQSSYAAQPGDVALFESEVRITAPNIFTEKGSISFGEDHRLLFSCFGQGQLIPSTDGSNLMCGAVTWKVEGGEGQFEGATGLITSNFTLSDTGEVNDYQLGLLFIR